MLKYATTCFYKCFLTGDTYETSIDIEPDLDIEAIPTTHDSGDIGSRPLVFFDLETTGLGAYISEYLLCYSTNLFLLFEI